MGSVKYHSIVLSSKLVGIGIVCTLLTAYFSENPSTGVGFLLVTGALALGASVHAILSTVDRMVEERIYRETVRE